MISTQVDAFLQSLIDFKGEDIAEDLVKRVQPFLDDPVFSYEKMKSKSAAAANLCAISASRRVESRHQLVSIAR